VSYLEHDVLLCLGLVLNATNMIGILVLYSTGFFGNFAAGRKRGVKKGLKIFAPK
jgi:hypothetical protein